MNLNPAKGTTAEKVKKKTAQAENSPGDAVGEPELLAPSESSVSTGDAFGAFLGMSYNGSRSGLEQVLKTVTAFVPARWLAGHRCCHPKGQEEPGELGARYRAAGTSAVSQ